MFRHPNLLTSRLVFSSCCQLWVLTPLMAYGQPFLYLHVSVGTQWCATCYIFPLLLFLTGSADSLLRTYFPDGMSESLIAYLLYGVLKALEYLHRMGYVHRSVRKTKHTNLITCSGDVGNLCLPVPYWLQRGEGQPHSAVRRGPRLPLGAPQCLQYDAWGEEDESGVWYAPPQPRPAALAQPWAAATGQELFSTMI